MTQPPAGAPPAEVLRRNAAQAFVEQHLALVEPIARHALSFLPRSPEFSLEDLIQAGRLGLCKAGWTFDASNGTPEEGWARRCIKDAIRQQVCGPAYRHAVSTVPLDNVRVLPVEEDPREEDRAEEVARVVQPALDENLTARQRKIVELHYRDGIGLQRIGRENRVGIGWRQVVREHGEALSRLKEPLSRLRSGTR